MRLRLRSPFLSTSRVHRRGIALVITLILLSVILVVTFALLAVSRRERSSVTTTQQQIDAEYMASTAFERAKATVAAQILSRTNINAGGITGPRFDLTPTFLRVGGTHLVSTSTNSYDPADFTPSYIASLQHDARVPVFIRTNLSVNNRPLDFRHYLDLNRNGMFESNGFFQVLGQNGAPLAEYASRRFFTMGDPEWLGVLDRPGLPHSVSNRFVGRYAFMVVPAGRVLDLNTIHNNAAMEPDMRLRDGYSRNQGVGTFEINLAAFLADLNTNQWGRNDSFYRYDLPAPLGLGTGIGPGAATGIAFDDARSMLMYRYGGNYLTLPPLADMFGTRGVQAFGSDFIDNYANDSEFEMRQGVSYVRRENESTAEPASMRWPGGENTNQFVLPNGFFNTNLIKRFSPNYPAFINRLQTASLQQDTYNRYTFYRLLSQMGTDTSSSQTDNRIHLNWQNRDGYTATNFVAWTPTLFFSNVADKLIRDAYPGLGLSFTNIPIYPTNYYTPIMHRLLQVAANLYEANTNRFAATNPRNPSHAAYLPTIFKPLFNSSGGEVRIIGYEEYDPATLGENLLPTGGRWYTTAELRNTPGIIGLRANVMGVPPIVATRKGYPSLNEVSLGSMVELTRRLQVRKTNARDNLRSVKGITNQIYSLAISNSLGFEVWNGYTNPYPRNLQLWVSGRLVMSLTDRDDTYNVALNPPPILTNIVNYGNVTTPVLTIPANSWAGGIVNNYASPQGFIVPIYTNIISLPGNIYDPIARNFIATNNARTYNPPEGFLSNPWVMRTTNEFVYLLYDADARRVVDVATMNRLESHVDILKELNGNVSAVGAQVSQLWRTNKLRGSSDPLSISLGAWRQMQISVGDTTPGPGETPWRALNIGSQSALQKEIDNFREFLTPTTGAAIGGPASTALWKQAPYVPTARLQVRNSWQANDPLVHYMPEHMSVLVSTKDGRLPGGSRVLSNIFEAVIVPNNPNETTARMQFNLGKMNESYYAWRGSPTKPEAVTFPDIGRQDPGVVSPDNWEFPTNSYPNVGWIGRVHRGTPWQSIYLKAYDPRWDIADGKVVHFDGVQYRAYAEAMGKPVGNESGGASGEPPTLPVHWNAHPTNDWLLVDMFTTASNDRATWGALGVNQSGLAAWSAVLSGITALHNNRPYQATNQIIQPALADTNAPLARIVNGINRTRASLLQGVFTSGGEILRVPEITVFSPYINTNDVTFIPEEVFEQIPRQIMSLIRSDEPRFVVYAFGQSLLPAPNGLVVDPTSPQYGICTNYQIMAESATRTVLRFDPRVVNNRLQLTPVVERFNQLPPE